MNTVSFKDLTGKVSRGNIISRLSMSGLPELFFSVQPPRNKNLLWRSHGVPDRSVGEGLTIHQHYNPTGNFELLFPLDDGFFTPPARNELREFISEISENSLKIEDSFEKMLTLETIISSVQDVALFLWLLKKEEGIGQGLRNYGGKTGRPIKNRVLNRVAEKFFEDHDLTVRPWSRKTIVYHYG